MKKSKVLSLLFFLVCLQFFINSNMLYSKIIDTFNSVSGWDVIGEGLKLSTKKGVKNKSLCMKYDLEGNRQWVVMKRKNLNLQLPENFEITFYVRGKGLANNLEFKLIDKKGNVFWKKWEYFVFSNKWQKIIVTTKDIVFAWGPDRNAKLSNVDSIEIAVSRGRGGTGTVCFDELKVKKGKKIVIENFKATASGAQGDELQAQNAVDGNKQTRWSSPFTDPQWLTIDMGKVKDLVGVTLYWENAYGSVYDIFLSKDGKKWKKVFTETDGDGKTDDIFFKKTKARYIKIYGRKRGTAWGYSLWEVEIKTADQLPKIKASSYYGKYKPALIVDGNMKTAWRSKKGGKQWLKIDLRKVKNFGGMFFYWGKDYAVSYEIKSSFDNKNWEHVVSFKSGNGKIDKLYFKRTAARYIKVIFKKGNNKKRYTLNEIIFKGPDEFLTAQKFYETEAEESPRGYYPRWIYNEQAFWTVTGVTKDLNESLLCEDGSVEPFKSNFSIIPFLYQNNKLITWNDVELSQSLEEKHLPIPSAEWKYKNTRLRVKMFTAGKAGESITYVWYRLKNNGNQKKNGKLYLSIRPFQVNPPWQPGGGLARITKLELDGDMIRVNRGLRIFPLVKFNDFGVIDYAHKDIVNFLAKGKLPDNKIIKDNKGYASGAIAYNYKLSPGESKDIFFAIPLHDKDPDIKIGESGVKNKILKLMNKTIKFWRHKEDSISIDIPEPDIINTLKANIAYILINRDKYAVQPGSRTYEHAWIRDGSLTCSALLKVGITKEVKEYLDWYVTLQKPNGEVPALVNNNGGKFSPNALKEYDSQGELIFIILQYYYFTRDKKFLKSKLPVVVKALKYLEYLRSLRLTSEYKNTRYYGILPNSVSHEGYFPEPGKHSYWDDFFALKGWKDGIKIAKILGRKDLVKWMEKEYKSFNKSVYDSIKRTMKEKRIDYIPGCAEYGDFDATSTAIAVIACDEYKNLPKGPLKKMFNRYFQDVMNRLKPNWNGGFTPYEIRSVQAFIYMNEKETALKLLDFLLSCRRPINWNHFAEVVFSNPRLAQYIGDMPHTWVGSGYINAVRSMFVYENENNSSLILGAGIDEKWLDRKKGISVKNLPTFYGKINYSVVKNNNAVKVSIKGSAKPSGGFLFKSPFMNKKISNVKINGQVWKKFTADTVKFKKLPVKIEIRYKK